MALRKVKVTTACGEVLLVEVDTDQEITGFEVVKEDVLRCMDKFMEISKLMGEICNQGSCRTPGALCPLKRSSDKDECAYNVLRVTKGEREVRT